MAPPKRDGTDLDVMALLDEVHGTEEGARSLTVEAAVRTLEATHRRASLAMRQFEQGGARPGAGAAPGQGAADPRGLRAEAPAQAPAAAPPPGQQPPTGPAARAEEVTAVWRPPPPQDGPVASAPGPGPTAPAPAQTPLAPEQPQQQGPSAAPAPPVDAAPVYYGEGAPLTLREPTRTQVVWPRKK